MNVRLMKCIDAAVGRIAASCLPGPAKRTVPSPITSLLLIRPGGIGDAALLAPTIHAIKKISPQVRITVLAERRNAGVFVLIAGVDRTFCYDSPCEFIQALRTRYDVVIDTEQWHRLSSVVARLVRAAVKIGFGTNQRRRMFTDTASYSQDDYEAISFFRLLEPLGIAAGSTVLEIPFLAVPDAAYAKGSALLASLSDQPFVTVFPGASVTERRWGADRFRSVAEMLSSRGVSSVVVGGEQDRQQGDVIVAGGAGLNLAGLTSLSETAAIIQKSRLLISADSGVLHIAVGLGVPTVSLFGPGRAKKWAPRGDNQSVINKEIACSPCSTFGTTPSCPDNTRCMREISADEIIAAVTTLL
jgi:ADP-heptose:LPS heptosyltransferase